MSVGELGSPTTRAFSFTIENYAACYGFILIRAAPLFLCQLLPIILLFVAPAGCLTDMLNVPNRCIISGFSPSLYCELELNNELS